VREDLPDDCLILCHGFSGELELAKVQRRVWPQWDSNPCFSHDHVFAGGITWFLPHAPSEPDTTKTYSAKFPETFLNLRPAAAYFSPQMTIADPLRRVLPPDEL
jgi:hypothetical protein